MIMLTITLLSLSLAAVSAFVAWRVIRREQQRSEARVAALAVAMDNPSLPLSDPQVGPVEHSLEFDFRSEDAATAFEMFAAQPSTRRGLITVVSGAAIVIASVVTIAMMSDGYEPPPQRVVAPQTQSLELLSLQAGRAGSSIAITGLVRSRTDEPLTAVTAVVSAIDAKGRPIGRASVPLSAILPRRESRFAVTIDNVGEAARYRVSFRSATGVIRHVDRRANRASEVS